MGRTNLVEMDLVELRGYALSLPEATEDFPFADDTLVFRVAGKIFLFMSLDGGPVQVSLKCDPDLSIRLREQYAQITPGFHMNKKHWITIASIPTLPGALVRRQVRHSYNCVRAKLPKAVRARIAELSLNGE